MKHVTHTVQVCTKPALCSNRKHSPPSLGALPTSVGQGRFILASVTVTIHSHGLCRYKRWACRPVTSRASQPSQSSSLLPGTRRLQNSPRHPDRTWSGEESSPCPPSRPATARTSAQRMRAVFHQERTKSLSIMWKRVFMAFEAFDCSLQIKLFYFYCES